MAVDDSGSSKNSVPNYASSCHERLPGPSMSPQHEHHAQPNYVRFSKVLHIREVLHRNDMSSSELNAPWDIDPEISPSIFDAHLVVLPSSEEEGEEKKRRKRRAYMIRKQVLSEFADSLRTGKDAVTLARNYTRYSAQTVQVAHVAALKHAHGVEEALIPPPAPLEVGAPLQLQRKRCSMTQPLAAVKRLRLS